MFENLTDRLSQSIKKISGNATLTEKNIDEMIREIRLALLEADVNITVVKEFVSEIKDEIIGQDVSKALKPSEMVVKIVDEKLTKLLGSEVNELNLESSPSIIMMVGLQGSGKTTTTGKIGKFLKEKQAKNPLFVAADVYRLAAVDQLKQLASDTSISIYEEGTDVSPVVIAKNAVEYAKSNNHDVVLIDTAGRLEIDTQLMDELVNIKNEVSPDEILLVVDALSGQNAVNVASEFNKRLDISGAVFTKLDSDARGGAALSIKHITGISIKFAGVGEKLEDLDIFYPERMSQRILGMGDVLSLIEKAEAAIDEKEAESMVKRMQKGEMDLDMFLQSMKQMKKLGPLEGILKMIPGASNLGLGSLNIDQKQMDHIEAIILSMTKEERKHPGIIKHSRKQRIVKGSGRTVQEVNKLLENFARFEQNKSLFAAMMSDDSGAMPNIDPMSLMRGASSKPKGNKKRMKRVKRG